METTNACRASMKANAALACSGVGSSRGQYRLRGNIESTSLPSIGHLEQVGWLETVLRYPSVECARARAPGCMGQQPRIQVRQLLRDATKRPRGVIVPPRPSLLASP